MTSNGDRHPETRDQGNIGPQYRTVRRERIAPISGRHRQIVADEFAAGLKVLMDVHEPYVSTARSAPPKVSPVSEAEAALTAMVSGEAAPAVDPDYLDENGHMLAYGKLAGVIRAKAFGDQQAAV